MQHPAPSVTLATGGYDRQIRFWSPQDGSCRHHIMFPDSVRLSLYICQSCLSFRSDATIVLRKYRTTLSHIFSLFSFRRDDGFTKYRTTLSHIFLCFHSDATIVLQKISNKQQINRLAISPQKNVIAAAGNPCAKLFDIHTSNTTFACDSHSGNITSVGFQRLGRWFYVRVFF